MALLGRVTGNTMTSVHPGNLKLVNRATQLILNHVNDTLSSPVWQAKNGKHDPLGYDQAWQSLRDAIRFMSEKGPGQTAEVSLSIIRTLENCKTGIAITWDQAFNILNNIGLEDYLNDSIKG
jgi:hypothetical protein